MSDDAVQERERWLDYERRVKRLDLIAVSSFAFALGLLVGALFS